MPSLMKSLRQFKGSDMEWIQPRALERHHELVSGQDVFATLTWLKVLGSLAEATTAEGSFSLKRGGFMRPFVTIRDSAMGNDVAVMRIGLFRHATLEFSNGRMISLVSTRFWGFEWEFIDENGQRLCSMRMRSGMMRRSAEVTINETVRRDRDLMIMLVIGWYTMVLTNEEAAAAAAAAASV
jgi:hypothetical protein